jgi:hypothetical protein
MLIKGIIDEDFINYKKPCMVIEFPYCSFKCDKECGKQVCQNGALANSPNIDIERMDLINRYLKNDITQSVVMQGLEPFDSWDDLISFIFLFRCYSDDDIVIYTGYNLSELEEKVELLSYFDNIIIKFGRYIPNKQSHYDNVLGVNLASDNQYAVKIS